jgi:hypothetical protein
MTVDDAKAYWWDVIKRERDTRMQDGGYKVGEYWFHSDLISRSQQLALFQLGEDIPPDLQWKTMSGEFVPMTPSLAALVFKAAIASDTQHFKGAEIARAVMNYDPLAFRLSADMFPKVFGE